MVMRRVRRRGADGPSAEEWAWLTDGPFPPGDSFERYALQYDVPGMVGPIGTHGGCRALWGMYRDQVLEAWRVEHPGTRPSRWWQYDAPRWPQDDMLERLRGAFFSADLPTPRRRLGGTGAPQFESLNVVPRFFKGVPVDWLDVDAADPPTYEAEAEYLHRHGLLSAAERTCYERGQLDLEPHVVTEGS